MAPPDLALIAFGSEPVLEETAMVAAGARRMLSRRFAAPIRTRLQRVLRSGAEIGHIQVAWPTYLLNTPKHSLRRGIGFIG
jgi:hypothetical protein